MTTRAGLSGLVIGGLLIAVLFYPFYMVWPAHYVRDWPTRPEQPTMVLAAVAAALLVGGGGWAAYWGGARSRMQRVALGALAGSLAGLVVFCALGAAAAQALGARLLFGGPAVVGWPPPAVVFESMIRMVWWTEQAFWALVFVGTGLGAVGGLYVRPFPPPAAWEEYDKRHPQMALNVAITAAPSAAVAALLAAGLFSGLPGLIARAADVRQPYSLSPQGVLVWPVVTALLLYLAALGALALVTPHEARMAEHRPGLDEVKMAAWVGIFVPPALAVGLYLINPALTLSPTVLCVLLVSGGLCFSQVQTLRRLILPKRAQMPPPPNLMEAVFFGSIARSQGPRLVVLCLGCGLAMMAPLYVSVGAPALSLIIALTLRQPAGIGLIPLGLTERLYLGQAALSLGLMGGAALVLTIIYLFYLWLGRRFSRILSREG